MNEIKNDVTDDCITHYTLGQGYTESVIIRNSVALFIVHRLRTF